MWCPVVFIWVTECRGTQFYMVTTLEGVSRIRDRMCAAIVSRFSLRMTVENHNECTLYDNRVTLYAEFLPTKQRAKCVVLLDVSLSLF